MTMRYEYECNICKNDYIEQRGATQSQFITACSKCGNGTYELINETKLADEIELVSAPVVETPAVSE